MPTIKYYRIICPFTSILIIPSYQKKKTFSNQPHSTDLSFLTQIKLNEASHFLSSLSHTELQIRETTLQIVPLDEAERESNEDKEKSAAGKKRHQIASQ